MLAEQEKELFCLMHKIPLGQYNDYEKTVSKFCNNHPEQFSFCDSPRELSIWMDGLTEKMAPGQISCVKQANIILRQEVLEKLNPDKNSFLSEAVENLLIRAYLLGRSGK